MFQFLKKIIYKEKVSREKNIERPSIKNISKEADYPLAFGYKCQWMAVKTNKVDEVVQALRLEDTQESNWKSGIESAYDDLIFISPVIKGWVLIIGTTLPDAGDTRNPNRIKPILLELSKTFNEVHYYGTHRIVEYHAWARAKNGQIERAFCYLGEAGEVLWDEGELTREERNLNFRFENIDSEAEDTIWMPGEEDVLKLSSLWSIDPKMKYSDLNKGVGTLGRLNQVQ